MRKTLSAILGLLLFVVLVTGLFACSSQSGTTALTTSRTTTSHTTTATSSASITITPAGTTAADGAQPVSAVQQVALSSITDVVAAVKPSVVAINVEVTTYDLFNRPVQESGAGSGWVIRSDGYIVTNNHVVDGATNIVVIMNDGAKYNADNVYTDTYTDLAVIKINASNLTALPTGNSSALNVGDPVVAIGNALGQGISATSGIVSAVGVSLTETAGQPLNDLVQTDAAINPGNSGGPLVNMSGEVIGIASVKISQVGVEGMGYAISINQALPVIDTLISSGKVVRPWMGISVYTVDAVVASYYNLPVDSGVLITDVTGGSPAANANLQPGDVITAVDGNAVTDAGALTAYINTLQIGKQVKITYRRGNNTDTVTITLAQNPS